MDRPHPDPARDPAPAPGQAAAVVAGAGGGGGADGAGVEVDFNPDYFIRVRDAYDILGVEIKQDGDDSNRNRAKYRDGVKHLDTLNQQLSAAGEPWRYHFYFLSPENYSHFFDKVREKAFAGWKSGLMQGLGS